MLLVSGANGTALDIAREVTLCVKAWNCKIIIGKLDLLRLHGESGTYEESQVTTPMTQLSAGL